MKTRQPAVDRNPTACFAFPVLAGMLFTIAWCGGCTPMPVPDPAVRYVALGDSATAGPARQNYTDLLTDLLDQPPEAFANEGVGGETAREGLSRLQQLVDQGIYPNAHTLLYWQGGAGLVDFILEVDPLLLLDPESDAYPHSDALTRVLDDIQAQIEDAINTAQQAGWTVFVATYYPLPPFIISCDPLFLDFMLPGQARHGNVYRDRLNARIRQAAANQSAILVDIAAVERLTADRGLYFDCNHLSVEGNRIVAQQFFDAIRAQASKP
jgi:lysophospholipase L1-like esterase